ncbi:MAG TPA: hypothetical protein VGI43_12405 [Mucilaginibacter sp.]|jgi:hypothetical protein
MHRKYYSFYLRNIFFQPSVKIDVFASNLRTQKIIIIQAINELRDKAYIVVEDDSLNLTPKGLAFLMRENLISADEYESAVIIDKTLPFIGISKNVLFKILAWVIGIACVAIMLGLVFFDHAKFLTPFLKFRIY